MTLTGWFPRRINPVHVGVYQCEWESVGTFYNKWDGGSWRWGHLDKKEAAKSPHRKVYSDDLIRWRGVAK